jgi:threonylcarbamoyladenosine tRNA methylthiotransferase MtaB
VESTSFSRYDSTVEAYYIENFGCRAAQADGSAIERQLASQGMHRVEAAEQADVVVLNTCTVTSAADQDARSALRRVHRQQPNARILVTGCYAQRAPEEISRLDGVTWVVGNSHKAHIGDIVSGSLSSQSAAFVPLERLNRGLAATNFAPQIYASDIFAHTELHAAPVFEGIARTRPNLKVQDGCNNRCSFCVIPYVRGHSRSLDKHEILRKIEELEAAGFREVVVSGINLGRWGRDFASPERFCELLQLILNSTSIAKLRLSSVEPMDWTEDLMQLVKESPRIAKHAHIPLQSGSDSILRKMHRKYRPWHYAEKVERIRQLMPDAGIGADVMVGFPGETDELFEESRNFIAQLPFTYLHVFTYSPRPGTAAATMQAQVPIQQARQRNRVLRELAAAKNLEFRRCFVGRTVEAITLSRAEDGETEALTNNYLKLQIRGQQEANRWMQVQIEGISAIGLVGGCV